MPHVYDVYGGAKKITTIHIGTRDVLSFWSILASVDENVRDKSTHACTQRPQAQIPAVDAKCASKPLARLRGMSYLSVNKTVVTWGGRSTVCRLQLNSPT